MGDRIAFGFRADKDEPVIWLYSHWGGASRYSDLANALSSAMPRWEDASYSTRIAMSTIIGDDWNKETGYGVSVGKRCGIELDYDEAPIVNWYNKTVTIESERDGTVHVDYGFHAFMSMTDVPYIVRVVKVRPGA